MKKTIKTKVLVVCGGVGGEREVSRASGKKIYENLDSTKYLIDLFEIKVKEDYLKIVEEVKKKQIDVVFNALHGEWGENGVFQAILEAAGVKYTGSGVVASAVGMNKKLSKVVARSLKIKTAKYTSKLPCVVKPMDNGSSVGVSVAKTKQELKEAVVLAKKYGEYFCEEYLAGTEVSCGVMGNKEVEALPVIEICPKNEFFDYEAKYTEGKCKEIVPARISQELTKQIQGQSVAIYKKLGCRGYARVDFIIYKNTPYFLEINTLPGMTEMSLLPQEAGAIGIDYPSLLDKIICLSLEEPYLLPIRLLT